MIVSPRLGGRNINFNPGVETLESRLWRACPVPGFFPVPSLCRLSGCFLNVYSITPWVVITCYVIFCSIALYYYMLFVVYYVLRMRFFILYHVICHYVSFGYCVTSWFRFCYDLLCAVIFSYIFLFGSIMLCYALAYYIIFPYTEKPRIKTIPYTETSLIKGNPL